MIECRCGMWVNPRYVIALRQGKDGVKVHILEGRVVTTDIELNIVLAMVAEVSS